MSLDKYLASIDRTNFLCPKRNGYRVIFIPEYRKYLNSRAIGYFLLIYRFVVTFASASIAVQRCEIFSVYFRDCVFRELNFFIYIYSQN